MSAPTIEVTLNKTSYFPGETMVLTVAYSDVDNRAITLTIVATDGAGHSSAPITVVANIIDAVALTVTSEPPRTWARISDTGAVAVFTAVA